MEEGIYIKLRRGSRDKKEALRTDVVRFDHPNCYKTEQDLTYFKDAYLRDLYVALFWHRASNVIEVLDEAVRNYPRSKFRIEQVRDAVLRQYVRDGKLVYNRY